MLVNSFPLSYYSSSTLLIISSDPCRLLHHKCEFEVSLVHKSRANNFPPPTGDGILPQCSRCIRTGRTCVRGKKETQFRQARGQGPRTRFPRNQVWVRPPPRGVSLLNSRQWSFAVLSWPREFEIQWILF